MISRLPYWEKKNQPSLPVGKGKETCNTRNGLTVSLFVCLFELRLVPVGLPPKYVHPLGVSGDLACMLCTSKSPQTAPAQPVCMSAWLTHQTTAQFALGIDILQTDEVHSAWSLIVYPSWDCYSCTWFAIKYFHPLGVSGDLTCMLCTSALAKMCAIAMHSNLDVLLLL